MANAVTITVHAKTSAQKWSLRRTDRDSRSSLFFIGSFVIGIHVFQHPANQDGVSESR